MADYKGLACGEGGGGVFMLVGALKKLYIYSYTQHAKGYLGLKMWQGGRRGGG